MKGKNLLISITAVIALTTSLSAGTIPGRWEKVASLVSGGRSDSAVFVHLKAGEKVECRLLQVRLHELVLQDSQGELKRLPKEAVRSITGTRKVQDKLRNGALIGAAVGFGAGFAALAAANAAATASGPWWGSEIAGYATTVGLLGAGLGALTGTVLDAAHTRYEVFYRAP